MRRLDALLLSLVLAGCAASPAVTAARNGDVGALRAAMAPALREGKLDDAEAARIAAAVADHELASARGDDAVARVLDVRPCADALEDALRERAAMHDEAGAAATLALLEAGLLSPADARQHLNDPADAWRAVGARGLVRPEDREARQHALVDASVAVRRAAMRACGVAKDPADVGPLLEIARLDPIPMARTEAVRAIARIDPRDLDLPNRLRDLWNGADDPLREDIAAAYAAPNIAASGGAGAIRVLVASGHGPGVVSSAAEVLRPARPGGPVYDEETRQSAIALLVRSIEAGPQRDRILAIAVAPIRDPDVLAAVQKASHAEGDADVVMSALSRLLDVPAQREAAKRALYAYAAPGQRGPVGQRARLALAQAGDRRIQAWIEQDLSSPAPSARLLAANALVSLDRAARAAPLLGDADVRVRTRAACTILQAVR